MNTACNMTDNRRLRRCFSKILKLVLGAAFSLVHFVVAQEVDPQMASRLQPSREEFPPPESLLDIKGPPHNLNALTLVKNYLDDLENRINLSNHDDVFEERSLVLFANIASLNAEDTQFRVVAEKTAKYGILEIRRKTIQELASLPLNAEVLESYKNLLEKSYWIENDFQIKISLFTDVQTLIPFNKKAVELYLAQVIRLDTHHKNLPSLLKTILPKDSKSFEPKGLNKIKELFLMYQKIIDSGNYAQLQRYDLLLKRKVSIDSYLKVLSESAVDPGIKLKIFDGDVSKDLNKEDVEKIHAGFLELIGPNHVKAMQDQIAECAKIGRKETLDFYFDYKALKSAFNSREGSYYRLRYCFNERIISLKLDIFDENGRLNFFAGDKAQSVGKMQLLGYVPNLFGSEALPFLERIRNTENVSALEDSFLKVFSRGSSEHFLNYYLHLINNTIHYPDYVLMTDEVKSGFLLRLITKLKFSEKHLSDLIHVMVRYESLCVFFNANAKRTFQLVTDRAISNFPKKKLESGHYPHFFNIYHLALFSKENLLSDDELKDFTYEFLDKINFNVDTLESLYTFIDATTYIRSHIDHLNFPDHVDLVKISFLKYLIERKGVPMESIRDAYSGKPPSNKLKQFLASEFSTPDSSHFFSDENVKRYLKSIIEYSSFLTKVNEVQSSGSYVYVLVADRLAIQLLGESIPKNDSIVTGLSFMSLHSRNVIRYPLKLETIPPNVLKVLVKHYAKDVLNSKKEASVDESLIDIVKKPLFDARSAFIQLRSSIELPLKDIKMRLSPHSQILAAKLLAIEAPVAFPMALVDKKSFRDITSQNTNFLIDMSLTTVRNVHDYIEIRKDLLLQKDRDLMIAYFQYLVLDTHLLEQIKNFDEALR